MWFGEYYRSTNKEKFRIFEHMWEYVDRIKNSAGDRGIEEEDFLKYVKDFQGYIETKTAWGVDDSEIQSKT